MQTQVLVQPPPLLALAHPPLPRVHHRLPQRLDPSPSPVLAEEQPPAAQSAPSDNTPTLHLLLDHRPSRSAPRDYSSLTSPRQYSISVSHPSQPTPHFPPAHLAQPRTHSPSDTASRPTSEIAQSVHISPSPSPPQIRSAPSFPPPYSAPHHQNHFASSETSCPPNMDRYSIMNLTDRYLRATDKYSHNQHPHLDHRRMSEPAMYGSAASTYTTNTADLPNTRYHQLQHQYSCAPPRSFGIHSSPPLHRSPDTLPVTSSSWKEDHRLPLRAYDSVDLEEPLSPLNPTFSGGESSSPMGMSGVMFGSFHEDYGPSPPNTGTSTSSNAPATHQQAHTAGGPSSPTSNKQYSFVSLAGNAVKKRPRRRYDQIERLYQCSWPNCTKAYGTLNHLNAHITMQKHGPKRSPNEFKELRKQWRKAKKEEAEARALDAVRNGSHRHQYPSQQNTSRHSVADVEYQTSNVCPPVEYAHPERSVHPINPLDDLHDSLAHQRDVQPRRSQRYSPFVSPHPQHSGITYPHPHAHGANPSNIPVNRLPTNSTLLTPLPGYGSSSVNGPPNFGSYDSYDLYRGDSRPRTDLGSPAGHSERGRPRSSHVNLGAGHNHDGQ